SPSRRPRRLRADLMLSIREKLSRANVHAARLACMRLDHPRVLLVESLHGRRVMTKVLLAEHDAALGHSVLHRLGKLDIIGEWVRSAAELDAWAAQLAPSRASRALEPSLVLLDWELPGAAAGEPLGVLQSLLPSATIVVLSEELSGD